MKRALIAMFLLLSSCSLVFVNKPPSEAKPNEYPDCHEASIAPIVDLVNAASGVALAVGTRDEDGEGNAARAVAGVAAGVWALSAVLGFRWTSRCKRLRNAWRSANSEDSVTLEPKAFRRPKEPARKLPDGSRGGRCFANASCFEGLYCDPSTVRCRPGNRGLEGGECFEGGACSDGHVCIDTVCIKVPPPNCRTDEHCPEGRTCQHGHCLEPKGALPGSASESEPESGPEPEPEPGSGPAPER